MMRQAFSAVAAGVLGLGALVGCSSTSMLNTTDVETAIADGLAAQIPDGSFSVACPDTVEAMAGAVFTCEATNATDGAVVEVTVTQSDDQGNVDWEVTAVLSEG